VKAVLFKHHPFLIQDVTFIIILLHHS